MQEVYMSLIAQIRDYFGANAKTKAVVGLSGGLDSGVLLKLLVDALKAENVTALHMPEHGLTNRTNTEHAERLADFFGVTYNRLAVNHVLRNLPEFPWDRSEVAEENLRARLRMLMLYDFANSSDSLVVGSANKTDLQLGYLAKYGDLGVDVLPLGDLFKTEVYKLAEFLHLPLELLNKEPSAELRLGQTDAEDLGADYFVIDQILVGLELGYDVSVFDPGVVRKVKDLIKANRHKSLPTPIFKKVSHRDS